jgi:hypothetical protein
MKRVGATAAEVSENALEVDASIFHQRLLHQLPQSWQPLLAQGVELVVSADGWKFDFTKCNEVIRI